MIRFLVRKTITDFDRTDDPKVRERYGVLGGVLGIFCNLILFVLKGSIGIFLDSIAILSDAFNNLSDMGSSLVALIGAKLSNKQPDREHPFGHGRIEYIASLIISFFILLVGLELLRSSFGKVLHPTAIRWESIPMILLALSTLLKVWMFSYNRYLGRQIDSAVLLATARDSLNDVMATGAVILSTVVGHWLSWPVDGVVGFIVALFILYAGFQIAQKTVGDLLGSTPDPAIMREIEAIILQGEGICGIHDLILHDYGPGRRMASVHAEVPNDENISRIHEIIDRLEQRVLKEMGIEIVIHMDPVSVHCERTQELKNQLLQVIHEIEPSLSIHDFRWTDGETQIRFIFDLVVPYTYTEKQLQVLKEDISARLLKLDSRYCVAIQIDRDYQGGT